MKRRHPFAPGVVERIKFSRRRRWLRRHWGKCSVALILAYAVAIFADLKPGLLMLLAIPLFAALCWLERFGDRP